MTATQRPRDRFLTGIGLLLLVVAVLMPRAACARIVSLTIIHTTDLHGHIWPTKDYEGHEDVGGFLRCASRIEEIRREKPDALLIDVGDTFQGAPENYLNGGRLLIDGLNQLKYDAWILGNHEFDWGIQALRALHDLAEPPFLAANLHFAPGHENWLPKIKPYVIRDVEGIRVAIVGLVTPGIPRWSRPHLLHGAMFKRSVESLQEIIPEVKQHKPDVLVVAAHQGFKQRGDDFANEIQAIARAFPEIDVLLGGHSHVAVDEMKFNGVLFTQAGYHGIWLGRVDLAYDTVKRQVVEKRSKLELMNQEVPFHAGLLERWKKDLDRAAQELARPLGRTEEKLSPRADAYGRSSMQQLISRAIAEGTDAELVLHGSLGDEEIEVGPLVYRDAWRIVPYENTIGIVSLTPQEIKDVLMENLSRPITPHTLGPYGFTYRRVPKGNQVEVHDLRDERGEPLHARKRYRVALNSYVLASGGERYLKTRAIAELPSSRLEMLEVDTRRLVIQHVQRTLPSDARPRNPSDPGK